MMKFRKFMVGFFVLCLCLITGLLLTQKMEADAAKPAMKGMKILKESKQYYFNLDGRGKKEKIYFKVTELALDMYKLSFYVNGKKVYERTDNNADLYYHYQIADLNKNTKGLDLFLQTTTSGGGFTFAAFQKYSDGKLKTTRYIYPGKAYGNMPGLIRIYNLVKVQNNGKFSITADIPFLNFNLHSCYVDIPFRFKGGKPMFVKTDTYEVSKETVLDEKTDKMVPMNKYKYYLNKKINLYKRAAKSSTPIAKLKKGQYITVEKVRPVINKPGRQYDLYLFVKDSNGKKGWIFVPRISPTSSKGLFQNVKMWG